MKVLEDGSIDFEFLRSTARTQQKHERGFTDQTACKIFAVALWYAQKAGDQRLSARADEDTELEQWKACARRSMAAVAINTVHHPEISFATRLSMAEDLGGVTVRSYETEFLEGMVRWLPGRTLEIAGGPAYGVLLSSTQPNVLVALQSVMRGDYQIAVRQEIAEAV